MVSSLMVCHPLSNVCSTCKRRSREREIICMVRTKVLCGENVRIILVHGPTQTANTYQNFARYLNPSLQCIIIVQHEQTPQYNAAYSPTGILCRPGKRRSAWWRWTKCSLTRPASPRSPEQWHEQRSERWIKNGLSNLLTTYLWWQLLPSR